MSNTVSRTPRRSRQFWLDHVSQWKLSGLSKAAYCQLHSINAGSFYNWSRPTRKVAEPTDPIVQRSTPDAQPEKSLTFTPVTLKPVDHRTEARFVHIQRAATDVALPTDLSADQIHSWLSAIHQLHV